jgi:hypothetical protein
MCHSNPEYTDIFNGNVWLCLRLIVQFPLIYKLQFFPVPNVTVSIGHAGCARNRHILPHLLLTVNTVTAVPTSQ